MDKVTTHAAEHGAQLRPQFVYNFIMVAEPSVHRHGNAATNSTYCNSIVGGQVNYVLDQNEETSYQLDAWHTWHAHQFNCETEAAAIGNSGDSSSGGGRRRWIKLGAGL